MKRFQYNGTGNSGSFAWLMQRISGIAILIYGLVLFYQYSFEGAHSMDAKLLLPILAFGLWHTFSGFKMITDDYVSCKTGRMVLNIIYWTAGIGTLALGFAII